LRDATNRRSRHAWANASGRFILAAVPAADYQIMFVSGSETISRSLKLEERDRAVVSVFFRHEAAGTVVATNEMVEVLVTAQAGIVAGVPGGKTGGVIGGIVASQRNRMEFAGKPFAPVTESVAVSSTALLVKEKDQAADSSQARVRSYFPEALYINPEIITDR